MLILALIWRFSLNGKYLEQTLKMISEFDYRTHFGEEEDENGKVS